MTILLSIIRTLGPMGCAALAVFLYYEGLPGINQLPLLEKIPVIREFGVGRVELERRAAVAGMVTKAELDAANAIIALEKTKSAAAEAMAAEASRRTAAALLEQERQDAEIDRLREEVKAVTGLTYPSKEDLEWSAKHR